MSNRLFPFALAFASGGLLSLMILFNGQWAANGTALFASWMAHGTGSLAALVFLAGIALTGHAHLPGAARTKAPRWAYLGGISGAATVMLSSSAVNSALALSGTLALGLVGQAGFSLACDRFGWFGLPRRPIRAADLGALVLILLGSGLIIFSGRIAR